MEKRGHKKFFRDIRYEEGQRISWLKQREVARRIKVSNQKKKVEKYWIQTPSILYIELEDHLNSQVNSFS